MALKRQRMLGESIRRSVAEALNEYKVFGGSVLSAVTVTSVDLSVDLKVAKVSFYSYLLDIPDSEFIMAFEKEKKNIRSLVCKELKSLRLVPELYFCKDKMLEAMQSVLVR